MTDDEFIRRAVGLPWRRWRSDWQAMDCFGLNVMWWREVIGIDPGPVPQTDIADGFAGMRGWTETHDPQPGCAGFMTWRDGAPTHCGVLAKPEWLLHSQAGRPVPESGSVRLTRLAVVRRLCPDIRFYAYSPC